LVEAQHLVSTLKLVDTLEEQDLLERLIDDSKPPVPEDCRELHYLLSTPFRYGAGYPAGSRFRRAGKTEGVFYAAEQVSTAVAELAFHRLLFFVESPGTPWPSNPAEYTAFSVAYATPVGIDLTAPPVEGQKQLWIDPIDYSACQDLADSARAARVEVIRTTSVRDPDHGTNVALLTCSAFAAAQPTDWQSWRIYLQARGVQAICEFPEVRISFGNEAFANDPRIAALRWDR
jgi:hypothetical protein